MAAKTFIFFPHLPSEIRLYIWKLVTTYPHTLQLHCTTPTALSTPPHWSSQTPTPILFHINSESRSVALSIYTLLQLPQLPPTISRIPYQRPLYINFEYDTLSLEDDIHPHYARSLLEGNESIKENLRRIVLRKRTWEQLNEVGILSPGPALDPRWDCVGYTMESFSVPVIDGLKALTDVGFHEM